MKNKRDPKQLLLNLARDSKSEVVHLPYSREFEAVCRQINPAATAEDKHRVWEELLRLKAVHATPVEKNLHAQPTPVAPLRPESSITAPIPSEQNPQPPRAGRTLFPLHDSIIQPWSVREEPVLTPEANQRRQKILAGIANSFLATTEQRVAHILHRFPETRDSDTALCIRYWKQFQPDVIERWSPLELEVLFELDRIETIGRMRRMIQELGLFRAIEETQRARQAAQAEFHEYLAAHSDSLEEIRFYLDETGNEGDKTYTGIGGVCVINWKQFEKHHAAMEQWRARQAWPGTIHFSETGADKVERAVSLLGELQSRRSGTLFLGYSLASRGRTQDVLFSLFIQLVVDALKHLQKCGCLEETRRVRVIKEADSGFDSLYLAKMTKQLGEVVALEFPGKVAVLPVEPVTKGRNVLLECADLIAGGMQRRASYKGRNPKDRLAEAVINVTGFEDSADPGTLFKYYAINR